MLSKVKQKPKSKLSLQTLNKLELESERQQRIGGTRPPARAAVFDWKTNFAALASQGN